MKILNYLKLLLPIFDKEYEIEMSEIDFEKKLNSDLLKPDMGNYSGIGYDPDKYMRGKLNTTLRQFYYERNVGPKSGHLSKMYGSYRIGLNISVLLKMKTDMFNYFLLFALVILNFIISNSLTSFFTITFFLYLFNLLYFHYEKWRLKSEFEDIFSQRIKRLSLT